MKKTMMTAPAILLGVFLMGTNSGSAQMSSSQSGITGQSSVTSSSAGISAPSDMSGIFHVDRFEKRGRKIYAVGWFGSMSDTLGRYSLRTPGSSGTMATSLGSSSSSSSSYGLSGSSSLGSGSGVFGGSSFGSSSGTFGGSSALYGSGSSSSTSDWSGDATTDYQSSSSYDEEQAIMYDLPGDRVDGFGNASPLDDMHESYMGTGGTSDDDLTGTTDAIHEPLVDVQKDGPFVDIQSNGQAVTGIDLNAPRLDVRDTLVSLRNDVNVESSTGRQPWIDAQSDGPLLDLQSNGQQAGIDVNLPRFDVRDDIGVSSSYDAASSMSSGSIGYDGGTVSYYNQDGDLTYLKVSEIEDADGMVALPVTFYGASCDQIQLALGPADGTPTMVNIGNPSTLDESSVGPFIVNLTSESTVRTVSNTMSDDEASLCMVSRLINGKASRTAIVDNLNKLIGAPIYGPERNGSMR